MIGTKVNGINLGLVHLVQDGRKWSLVEVDEHGIITEIYYSGSRAKAAQEAAKMTGRLCYFWYECITQLQIGWVKLTPVQVQRIAGLTYQEMVQLNEKIISGYLPKWLDGIQISL